MRLDCRWRRRVRVACCQLVFAAASGAAHARDVDSARADFEHAYELVQQGDYEGGIVLFERAYTQRPHFSVLYNLAQAYAAAGKPLFAVSNFERYLAEGGTAIAPERRTAVLAAIALQAQRLGHLALSFAPQQAQIYVDGERIASLDEGPLRLAAGKHVVRAELEGHEAVETSVQIVGGQLETLKLELRPTPHALFSVACRLPQTTLRVDDAGELSLSGRLLLRLAVGEHRFSFERAGYLQHATVALGLAGGVTTVPCALRVDPASTEQGALHVHHPGGTRLRVDGEPFAGGMVPVGVHDLEVLGADYQYQRRVIRVAKGQTQRLDVPLDLTTAELARREREADKLRRTLAYALGAAGVASLGTAVGLMLYDNSAHARWQQKNDALVTALSRESSDVTGAKFNDLLSEENEIRDRDAVALGLAVFGGVLAAGAAVLGWWPTKAEPRWLLTRSGEVQLGTRF